MVTEPIQPNHLTIVKGRIVLPIPFTIVLELKNVNSVAKELNLDPYFMQQCRLLHMDKQMQDD